AVDAFAEARDHIAEPAGFRHQQIAILRLLAPMLLVGEARAFHEVQHARRTVSERRARALRRFLIVLAQAGIARDRFATVAPYIRKPEQPHCDAEKRYPDELSFHEELQGRNAIQKRILQYENVGPALMIGDHDVPSIAPKRFARAHRYVDP